MGLMIAQVILKDTRDGYELLHDIKHVLEPCEGGAMELYQFSTIARDCLPESVHYQGWHKLAKPRFWSLDVLHRHHVRGVYPLFIQDTLSKAPVKA